MSQNHKNVRVLFCCTGVGIFNRGIESFFREAFDGLKNTPGLDAWLIKGAGEPLEREIPVWCLPRTGRAAHGLGKLLRRNSYIAEQLSSFLPVVRQIRRLRPQVIFYSEANLGFQLFFRRQWIGVPYRLLFSNGGPGFPPFDRTDFVQQVAPLYLDQALKYGEPAAKHFLMPYGIQVPREPVHDLDARRQLRQKLNIPVDRPVVLSVGWISRQHKRMHYVVEELARMPQPRPFLQLLGAMDDSSREIIDLADQLLGREGYSAKSVPYKEVSSYYRAADLFVLASLEEGFGRVYLEALMHGLPIIAHRHPVMEYVLGQEGILADLNQPGELTRLLTRSLQGPPPNGEIHRRWLSVQKRFSWASLAPQYLEMFRQVSTANKNLKACAYPS